MPKHTENFPIRRDLPLLLILNLCQHQRKLPLHILRVQVPPDPGELAARLLDLTASDQMARGIRHKGDQAQEHDDAPGDLDPQRKTPLDGTVRGEAAGVAHPVGGHCSEGDSAPGDASDEAAIAGV